MIPEWNSFINADCMEYLRKMPDKCVDLAITDPPYGGGFTEGGGCQGWFAKYRQDIDRQTDRQISLTDTEKKYWNRFGGRFDKYKGFSERPSEIGGAHREQAEHGRVSTGKKSYRGILPRKENILNSSFVSHEIR